ncbi:hypothetical protein Tco_0040852 [Tanacetum coccineum]
MDKYLTYFLCPYWLRVQKVLLATIRLINLKSKKVGEDTNCSHFIIQFEFCRINKVVSILPLSGMFSCERDGGGFHYFSKLCGLFMAKATEILIALSLATKAGCYHDLFLDDFNARFLSKEIRHLFQGRLLYSFWQKAIFFPPCKPSRSETYVSASVKEIDYVQLGIVNQAELKLQPKAFFSFCTAAYTEVKILPNLLRT